MGLGVDQACGKPVPEEMRHVSVTLIEIPGICTVQIPDGFGETRVRSLNDQVVVVPHQAISKTAQLESLDYQAEPSEERSAILVVEE